jgi:hypothetical protein
MEIAMRTCDAIALAALCAALMGAHTVPASAGFLDLLFGRSRTAPSPYDNHVPPFVTREEPLPLPRRPGDERTDPSTIIEIPTVRQYSTCCKHGEDPMKALLSDSTLVRGDVVMTHDGLRVFLGSRAPHQWRDFVPIRQAPFGIAQRRQLLALER